MRSNTHLTRKALVIGIAAMALAGPGLSSAATAGPMSRLACYVALASDLTPLIDASRPDSIADSPECTAQTQSGAVTGRKLEAAPQNDKKRKPAKTG